MSNFSPRTLSAAPAPSGEHDTALNTASRVTPRRLRAAVSLTGVAGHPRTTDLGPAT